MMSFCVREVELVKCFWLRLQDVVGPRLFSRRAGGESKTYISGLNIDKTSQQMNLIQTGSDEFDLLKNMLTRDNLQNVNIPQIFPRSSSYKIHSMTSHIEWTRWMRFSDENGKYNDFLWTSPRLLSLTHSYDTISIIDDNANFDVLILHACMPHVCNFAILLCSVLFVHHATTLSMLSCKRELSSPISDASYLPGNLEFCKHFRIKTKWLICIKTELATLVIIFAVW